MQNNDISVNSTGFAAMPTTTIQSPGEGVNLAAVPKFEKTNFSRWLRDWKKFTIANRFSEAYDACKDGSYSMRVLQGTSVTNIKIPMTQSDVANIRQILLAALPQDLAQQYEEKNERFPSAKLIVADLKEKYEGESDLMAARALWRLPSLRCNSIDAVEKHISEVTRMYEDIAEAKCSLTDRTKNDLLARTINISALKATIETELSAKRPYASLVAVIEKAARRFLETLHNDRQPSATGLAAQPVRCYNCQQLGHVRSECRNKRVRVNKSSVQHQPTKKRSMVMKSLVAESADLTSTQWIVDSGASLHMTSNAALLQDKKQIPPVRIEAADGKIITSSTTGTVDFGNFQLKDVHLFPELKFNLLSVSTAAQSGVRTIFDRKHAIFEDSSTYEQIATADISPESNVYLLAKSPILPRALTTVSDPQQLWHSRLGHPNQELTKRMISEFNLTGGPDKTFCTDCALGKCTRSRHPPSSIKTTSPLERLHMDLVQGPATSLRGNNYLLTVVDDFSRFCWIAPLKSKDQAHHEIKSIITREEKRLDALVKTVKTDGGTEFVNQHLADYFDERGIDHQLSAPGTAEQNGVAERKNGTIVRTAKTFLVQCGAPTSFWDFAAEYAAYTSNLWLDKNNTTAFQKYFGRQPKLTHLRIFGCGVIFHVPKEKRRKFDPSGKAGIFIGFTKTPRNCWVYDPVARRTFFTADARFQEDVFPFKAQPNTTQVEDTIWAHHLEAAVPESDDTQAGTSEQVAATPERDNQAGMSEPEADTSECSDQAVMSEAVADTPEPNDQAGTSEPEAATTTGDQVTTRYGRNVKRPSYYVALTVATSSSKNDKWAAAMQKELDEFDRLQVRKKVKRAEVQYPPVIDCRWVLKEKSDGTLRARIVVRGFLEQLTQSSTYAPTAAASTLRLALAVAAKKNFNIYQADFSAAFLNAKLHQPVMVKPPAGIDEDYYWRLEKAVYGLKVAPRSWFDTISTTLKELNLQQSLIDQCLFFTKDLLLVLYVDDILIMTQSVELKDSVLRSLNTCFRLRTLTSPFKFVGLRIQDTGKMITIDQEDYIDQLAADFEITTANVMEPIKAYRQYNEEDLDTSFRVKPIIGALRFVADRTRPDIAFATGYLSRFCEHPSQQLYNDCMRVLQYLVCTKHKVLAYHRSGDFNIDAYADASHISKLNLAPTLGIVISCGESWVHWASRKIRSASGSSTESELVAIQTAYKEAEPLRQLLVEELACSTAITIHCDNTSALAVIQTGRHHNSSYIDYQLKNRLRILRESGCKLRHIPTSSQPADLLTKPLLGQKMSTNLNFLLCDAK